MKFRSTFILLLLTAALGAFIWFHERSAETTEQSALRAHFALRFDPKTVSKIDLASPSLRVRLAKQGDGWHIAEPIQTLADDARVEELLTHLMLLESSQIITSAQLKRRKQRRADYGLDQPRWKISFGNRDHETVLNVGASAPTGDAIYLQLDGERDVIVSPTNLLGVLPATVADYRNRRLLPGTAEEVSRIELRSRAGFIQATRSPTANAWQITKPIVARGDSSSILSALRPLFAAKIVDFEASSKVGASLYGFDEPSAQCSILARDGTIEQTLLLGKIAEGRTNLVYATKQGEEDIFTVDRSLLAALERSADDLRDTRVLPVPPTSVAAIRIEEGETTVAIEATNGVWFVTAPRLAAADAKKIALAIAEWSGSHARSFNDQSGTNTVALGFAPPAARYTFTIDAAARAAGLPSNVVFEASSLSETGALRTLRMLGEEALLRVEAATLSTLPAQPLYFRTPIVLSVDTGAIRSLTFDSQGTTNVVALDGTNTPSTAVAAMLDLLHPLRARTLITEDTRSLATYGLQPAVATLTIGLQSTGSVSRIVHFGKPAPEGGRYASVQGLDLVFTLDSRTADALLKPANPSP